MNMYIYCSINEWINVYHNFKLILILNLKYYNVIYYIFLYIMIH